MNKETARVLLSLIDSGENTDIVETEYIGQGMHKIYILDRDDLVKILEEADK